MSTATSCRFRWALLGLFALICGPLIFSADGWNFDGDERAFYVTAIARIAPHWPAINLHTDTTSAVSPGYPYFLAGFTRVAGVHLWELRLITWGLSAGLLAWLATRFSSGPAWLAAAAVLPLATSNFFVKSASRVVTDNPALLFMAIALTLIPGAGTARLHRAGLAAALACWLRQIHGWLLLPLAAGAWLDAPADPRSTVSILSILFRRGPALLTLLAVGAWLFLSWGGPVPPEWATVHTGGITLAPLACLLCVYGPLGLPYLLTLATPAEAVRLLRSGWVAGGAAVGLLLALASPTTQDVAAGRWGGYFWRLVEATPAVAERSLLITAGAVLGGALLGAMALRLREAAPARARIWALAFLGWALSTALNRLAFQRYFEPPILIFLIWWLVLLLPSAPQTRFRWQPLAGLAAVQMVITLVTVHFTLLLRFRS